MFFTVLDWGNFLLLAPHLNHVCSRSVLLIQTKGLYFEESKDAERFCQL